nr:hypothetical protein [Tanacetum cinerariifolium]
RYGQHKCVRLHFDNRPLVLPPASNTYRRTQIDAIWIQRRDSQSWHS